MKEHRVMNKRILDGYRRRLKQLADRMQTDASAVSEQAREPSGGQGAGDLSNAPMHLGDMGTEEFLQDVNATLLENEEYLVREAREALRRIDAGTFGRCEECGQEIPRARLDALLYARFCTQCAEAVGVSGSLTHASQPIQTVINRRPSPADQNLVPPERISEMRPREKAAFQSDTASGTEYAGDSHAAGTPGGGSAVGGLAGSNAGYGDPDIEDLEEAMGSGLFDRRAPRDEPEDTPKAGRSGGAVGGTPAGKRTSSDRPPSKG
jgi:RNA polymerase-binding transcription factor DksA